MGVTRSSAVREPTPVGPMVSTIAERSPPWVDKLFGTSLRLRTDTDPTASALSEAARAMTGKGQQVLATCCPVGLLVRLWSRTFPGRRSTPRSVFDRSMTVCGDHRSVGLDNLSGRPRSNKALSVMKFSAVVNRSWISDTLRLNCYAFNQQLAVLAGEHVDNSAKPLTRSPPGLVATWSHCVYFRCRQGTKSTFDPFQRRPTCQIHPSAARRS